MTHRTPTGDRWRPARPRRRTALALASALTIAVAAVGAVRKSAVVAAPAAQSAAATAATAVPGSAAAAAEAAQRASFADALAGLIHTLRTERGLPPLARVAALDRVAADQAGALAAGNGLPAADADAASLSAAVTAAGWRAPPELRVERAHAVRRSLEQAADWFANAENPAGAALFDPAATAMGAGAARLADGRIAWVVITGADAPPPAKGADARGDAVATDADAPAAAAQSPGAAFAVTALPPASGEPFGPALPDPNAAPGGGTLSDWTPTLQRTARVVVALVVGLFALTALRLKGVDRN